MYRELAKQVVKGAFASTWGWRVAGRLVRPPGVIVLMYHRINGADESLPGLSVDMFREEMRWVSEHCEPIRHGELIARASEPRSARPAVLVTFDDGYRDYHDLAYPVLKRFGIPAVVFLATSFMDEGGMIWTDQVHWAAVSTRESRVPLPWGEKATLPATTRAEREELSRTARGYLKKLPDAERQALLPELLQRLGEPPARDRQMLSWDEVRATLELTEYGGHSHTHPIMSRLSRERAEAEIRTCRDRISAETGRTPTTFAYPNGGPADYTEETKELLRQNGFTLGFSTSEGIASRDSDWMAIKRLPGEATSVRDFAWLAAGLQRS